MDSNWLAIIESKIKKLDDVAAWAQNADYDRVMHFCKFAKAQLQIIIRQGMDEEIAHADDD